MANTRLSLADHDVWITAGGKELEHYGMEFNETKKEITCWIPSEENQPFSVHWQKVTRGFPSKAAIYLDGRLCSGQLQWADMLTEKSVSYFIVSQTERCDFRFAPLDVTDDDTYLESSGSIQNIGEIKVIIKKVVNAELVESPVFNPIPVAEKVHERSKKALSHQIKFSEKKQLEQTTAFWKVLAKETLGTFIFRYRPLAMLQANGIAPQVPPPLTTQEQDSPHSSTPPPQALHKRKASSVKEESEDEDESGDVEAREKALLDRLSTFQAEIDKIRNEKAELDKVRRKKRARKEEGGSTRRVKEEPKTYFTPGEVIDLT